MTPQEYKAVMDRLATIEAGQATIIKMLRAVIDDNGSEPTADDRDLDGQYGDSEVKYDLKEKYWKGESFKGKRWSQCSPEYLDATAEYLTVYARVLREKDGDERKAGFKDKDAARCRGWARRIRNGYKSPFDAPQTAGRGFGGTSAGYGSPGAGSSAAKGYGGASSYGASGGYGGAAGSYGASGGEYQAKDEFGNFNNGSGSDDDIPF